MAVKEMERFEVRYSRTPRILHIGNILNNGYLNCKFLGRLGVQADLLNVDYRHVQGQPEWEEVYIREPLDHFNPDWQKVNLRGFLRPPWFFDVRLSELEELGEYLKQHNREVQNGELGDSDARAFSPRNNLVWRILQKLKPRIRRIVTKTGILEPSRSLKQKLAASRAVDYNGDWQALQEEYRNFYPDQPPLNIEDITEWHVRSRAYSSVLSQYPLIQAYSLDPIHVLLGSPGRPFICFEHGTLRDFPFENSSRGRLYALCLKKAEWIIITNADCRRSAERLGLSNYRFIPHPVDEELYKPNQSELRKKLQEEHGCDWIFIAPARHHWKNCPPGLENSWFKRNDILIGGLAKLFRRLPDLRALVIFFEWGQEVNLSKKLIRECGIEDKVRWEPLCSKPAMVEFYNAADIVLDQFNDGIGTFGTVVPESLACKKPVVLNYKRSLHHWCYTELPPVLNAKDEESIAKQMQELLDNDFYRFSLGDRGLEWFMKYHSSTVVVERLIDIYRSISEKYGWGWTF
jgi:glycosyltransferase involved in cell wall biosynthesis